MDVPHQTPHQTDDEQTTFWNGLAGRAWVEAQELLDQQEIANA